MLDSTGKPISFFHSSINEIPDDAVRLTDEQWQRLADDQAAARFVSGAVTYIEIEPPHDHVPIITPRQLRLWLLKQGILSQVPGLIDTMLEPERSAAQIEWEFAPVFQYDHDLLQALASAIGMSPEEIKAGFREAALL